MAVFLFHCTAFHFTLYLYFYSISPLLHYFYSCRKSSSFRKALNKARLFTLAFDYRPSPTGLATSVFCCYFLYLLDQRLWAPVKTCYLSCVVGGAQEMFIDRKAFEYCTLCLQREVWSSGASSSLVRWPGFSTAVWLGMRATWRESADRKHDPWRGVWEI